MRTPHTEITSQAEVGTPRLTPGSWYASPFGGSRVKKGCGFPRAHATGLLYAARFAGSRPGTPCRPSMGEIVLISWRAVEMR